MSARITCKNTHDTYLGCPPPLASIHIVIQPVLLCFVCIVSFGRKDKVGRKFLVSEQRSNASNNVPIVDIKGFPGKYSLGTLKAWSAGGQLLVNDAIKLTGVFI